MFPNTESEQFISMVHETATKYLVRNGTVNLLQEHIDMALFCCRYLSSRPFTTGKSQDISAHIHSGYYGFLDYAAAHYAVHIQKTEAPDVSTDSCYKLEDVKAAALALANANCKEVPVQTEQTDVTKATQDLELAIQANVLVVRTLIGQQREKSETAIFDATEGPVRHKCHKIQCSKFSTGCPNEAALKEHLTVHERPFRCPHADCFAHRIGYPSPKRLESHNEAFHQSASRAKAVFPADLKAGEWNIHRACKAGNLDEVKRFHREGIDLRSTHSELLSLLSTAVEAGHGHICRYLVDIGVDPFLVESGRTASRNPVVMAIYRERLDILDFFLRSGNGPDDRKLARAIAQAIHADRPAPLGVLLSARPPRGHTSVMEQVPGEILFQTDLRSLRRDSHHPDATLIHAWFQYVKPEFYNEKGVCIAQSDSAECNIWRNLRHRSGKLLHTALRKKCYSLATFLMDIGIDEYLQHKLCKGYTTLHSCIKGLCKEDCSSCWSMFQRLIKYDGDTLANIPDSKGRLPAHTALIHDVPQTVLRAVLGNTRNPNHRNDLGQSLLHVAFSAASIRVLLENKSVDTLSRNNKGQTAFSAFIHRGQAPRIELLDYLFKADSRLAWTPDESEEGLTPLHYALEYLYRPRFDYHNSLEETRAARLLLTCFEVKRVLVYFQAKSSEDDQIQVREFAARERLLEAMEIMDSIGFGFINDAME
ncbi:hypothetical protein BFJ72_g6598 [Fusarium proliferatum]|uniref:Uncharacterized protein n=1 Tax=Gibberella intermedia TaxID=948311 RepID=A0A420TEL8_GIBIN|nr:hypothetical protein BFJ72_g6598 [Fusarium proliferatum]